MSYRAKRAVIRFPKIRAAVPSRKKAAVVTGAMAEGPANPMTSSLEDALRESLYSYQFTLNSRGPVDEYGDDEDDYED